MTLNVAIPKKSEPCKKRRKEKKNLEIWNFPFEVFGKKYKEKGHVPASCQKMKKSQRVGQK